MVKSLISILVVCCILTMGAIFESSFIKKEFSELNVAFTSLYEKVDDKTAVEDDVISVKENWLQKKRYLHAFIPHNEIKEIDLWVFETATLVRDKKWEDALSKVEVLKNLTVEIPKTFAISFENIL